jgi:ABC-type branched-subunit amino acid transport system ATPase component
LSHTHRVGTIDHRCALDRQVAPRTHAHHIANEQELTLLFTEHAMEIVFSISDTIAVLHQGSIIATDPPDELRRNDEVRAFT